MCISKYIMYIHSIYIGFEDSLPPPWWVFSWDLSANTSWAAPQSPLHQARQGWSWWGWFAWAKLNARIHTFDTYTCMYIYIYTITIINITQVYPSIVFILASTSLPSQHSSKSDIFRLSFQRDPTKPIVTIDGNPIIWWPPTNPRFCRAQWLKASVFRAVHNFCKNPNYILQLQTILPDGNSPLVKPPHKNFPQWPNETHRSSPPRRSIKSKKRWDSFLAWWAKRSCGWRNPAPAKGNSLDCDYETLGPQKLD